MEERCLLCHKPVDSLVADPSQCLKDLTEGALACPAWRVASALGPQEEETPSLPLWVAAQASPPVPWRLLLRLPCVRWGLLFLLGWCAHAWLCTRGW
jgi:hypothetical protein